MADKPTTKEVVAKRNKLLKAAEELEKQHEAIRQEFIKLHSQCPHKKMHLTYRGYYCPSCHYKGWDKLSLDGF